MVASRVGRTTCPGCPAQVGRRGGDFFFVQALRHAWGFKVRRTPRPPIPSEGGARRRQRAPQKPDVVVCTARLDPPTDDDAPKRHKRCLVFIARVKAEQRNGSEAPVQALYARRARRSATGGKAFQGRLDGAEATTPTRLSTREFTSQCSTTSPLCAVGHGRGRARLAAPSASSSQAAPARTATIVDVHAPPTSNLARGSGTDGHEGRQQATRFLLQHWKNVTVFYGHIIEEHHSADAPAQRAAAGRSR